MTFLEKLDYLMNRDGYTIASLSRASGIPYTTLDGLYKKGYANTKLSTLQKICDFFNVTLDYLVKDEINDPRFGIEAPDNDPIESEIISIYRRMNHAGKEYLLNTARICLGNPDMTKNGHCESAM